MTETFGIKVLQPEGILPGQVVFRVTGVEHALLDESFIIRRADDQSTGLWSDWPSGPRMPVSSQWYADSQVLELVVGAEVVNPIAGGTPVIIRLPGLANREATLIWPDGLLLAVAQNRRRGQGRREVATPSVSDTPPSVATRPPSIVSGTMPAPAPPPPIPASRAVPIAPPVQQAPTPPPAARPAPMSTAPVQVPPAAPSQASSAAPSQVPPAASARAAPPPAGSQSGPPVGTAPPPARPPGEPPRPAAAPVGARPPAAPVPQKPPVAWDRPQRTGLPIWGTVGAVVVVLGVAAFFAYQYGFAPDKHSVHTSTDNNQVKSPPPPVPVTQPNKVPDIKPPPAQTASACSDQHSDYETAMRKFFKERREAARLLKCAKDGPDKDMAELADKALTELESQ